MSMETREIKDTPGPRAHEALTVRARYIRRRSTGSCSPGISNPLPWQNFKLKCLIALRGTKVAGVCDGHRPYSSATFSRTTKVLQKGQSPRPSFERLTCDCGGVVTKVPKVPTTSTTRSAPAREWVPHRIQIYPPAGKMKHLFGARGFSE